MMYNSNLVAVISCNGKILRERDSGVVYLPFGSDYSIRLKNMSSQRAVVSVEVDGENVFAGRKLIVSPNSTEEVKGFMRNMKETNKFKFIHKTKQIQSYRGDKIDDGLVRITYQFEQSRPVVSFQPTVYVYTPYYWDNRTYCSSKSYAEHTYSVSNTCDAYTYSSSPRCDEGITVKGAKINQGYVDGCVSVLDPTEYSIVIYLKGVTSSNRKISTPLTVRSKLTCATCGKVSKSSSKFCSRCGTYLE